ncbi:hypothetical protein [Limosilactobacillus mucosae]|uniref:hypothetical protein n=1 Tax=Limosilactobacillus mucosae TaxID=97478 RepID=UPI0022E7B7A5|nr:hypothetical protein [Limosilactobacillus mucosae]
MQWTNDSEIGRAIVNQLKNVMNSDLEAVKSIISWSPKKCNEQTILKSAPINIRVVSTAND